MTKKAQTLEGPLPELIEAWRPSRKPHCSSCVNARVHGEPDAPMAYCREEHGKFTEASGREVALARLIRPVFPLGWKVAGDCPDWEASG